MRCPAGSPLSGGIEETADFSRPNPKPVQLPSQIGHTPGGQCLADTVVSALALAVTRHPLVAVGAFFGRSGRELLGKAYERAATQGQCDAARAAARALAIMRSTTTRLLRSHPHSMRARSKHCLARLRRATESRPRWRTKGYNQGWGTCRWRIRTQAGIGVRNRPRQCSSQAYWRRAARAGGGDDAQACRAGVEPLRERCTRCAL
jgi:hypothetical protein